MTQSDLPDWVNASSAYYQYDNLGTFVVPNASGSASVDVSAYASIDVQMVPGAVGGCAALVQQYTPGGIIVRQDDISVYSANSSGEPLVVRIPVVGTSVNFSTWSTGAAITFTVFGTNRITDRARTMCGDSMRRFQYQGTLAIGQVVQMTGVSNVGADSDYFACGSAFAYTMEISGTNGLVSVVPRIDTVQPGGLVASLWLNQGTQVTTSPNSQVNLMYFATGLGLGNGAIKLTNTGATALPSYHYIMTCTPIQTD